MSNDVIDRDVRRVFGALRDAAPPVPDRPPSTGARSTPPGRAGGARRGVLVVVAAALVGVLVVAVASLRGDPQRETISSATTASTLPTPTSAGSAAASTTSGTTAATTVPPSLTTVLPDWTVTRVSRTETDETGRATTQRWGVRDTDGVSYSQMVELMIFPINGDPPDTPVEWIPAGGPGVVWGRWFSGGFQHDVHAYGLTATETGDVVSGLTPRDRQQPLQGYDAAPSALQLVEEELGSVFDAPVALDNVSIALERTDGTTMSIDVVGRDRLPLAIDGTAARRAELDRHVAVVSATDAEETTVAWTQDGAQIRISTRLPLDDALRLAEHIEQIPAADLLGLPSS